MVEARTAGFATYFCNIVTVLATEIFRSESSTVPQYDYYEPAGIQLFPWKLLKIKLKLSELINDVSYKDF